MVSTITPDYSSASLSSSPETLLSRGQSRRALFTARRTPVRSGSILSNKGNDIRNSKSKAQTSNIGFRIVGVLIIGVILLVAFTIAIYLKDDGRQPEALANESIQAQENQFKIQQIGVYDLPEQKIAEYLKDIFPMTVISPPRKDRYWYGFELPRSLTHLELTEIEHMRMTSVREIDFLSDMEPAEHRVHKRSLESFQHMIQAISDRNSAIVAYDNIIELANTNFEGVMRRCRCKDIKGFGALTYRLYDEQMKD